MEDTMRRLMIVVTAAAIAAGAAPGRTGWARRR
jgi:hypothetical protein